jgi:tetratricopeptide (TPR) repeat protein
MIRRFLFIGVSLLAVAVVVFGLRAIRSRPAAPTMTTSIETAPRPATPIEQIVRSSRTSPPVIFIGLDGADWQLLDQYVADGAMPNLAGLVREGTVGTVETMHPALSPIVWTSMMTGVSPLKHRILDFLRLEPASGRKEPITADERRAPAIWNMASWGDRSVAVFGLWATYPAEDVKGLMVSDRLFSFLFKEDRPPAGVVFPASEENWARTVARRAEESVGLAELKVYLRWLTEADYAQVLSSNDLYTSPASALRRTLIETRVYDELAEGWLARHQPDLSLIYFQGTDSIGHTFAAFAPPKLPTVTDEEYQKYRAVPRTYFSQVDRLLGNYRRMAEQRGARILLASDHGFTWMEGRPTTLSSYAHATASKWHRKDGIYVLWGPGIGPRDTRSDKASVLQINATLLALLGLPPQKDAAARPLPGAPDVEAPPVDYAAYFRPPARPHASAASRVVDEDALARLRALGYIGAAESTSGRRVEATRSAGSYNNEGLVLKDEGRREEAIKAYENALIVDPNYSSAMWNLSDLLFAQAIDLDRSDMLLVRAFGSGLPEGRKFLIGRAIGYQRNSQLARSLQLLQSALRIRPEEPEVWLFSGRYRVEQGDCAGGVSDMEKGTRLAPGNPSAFASLGLARLCAGDRTGALKDLHRSLELDPAQPAVRDYIQKLGGRS